MKLTYNKYEWVGWLGNTLTSYENGVKEGDVRKLKDKLIYAYRVNRRFFRNKVSWCLVDCKDYEEIQKFKNSLFNLN